MRPHVHGIVELALTSSRFYANPLWDCELTATFVAKSGRCRTIRGFWDGGKAWRVRFSPDEPGHWSWTAQCSVADDAGLAGARGEFDVAPYDGENPLYRHGPVRASSDGRSFRHADGTPFFWLGDTAWNGVIRGDDGDWGRYLGTRALQRFTVVQFVATHWRGDALDECGEPACTEEHPIRVNPAFFRRIDRRVAMVNEAGLLAAPIALWSLLKTDLGYKLSEDDATRMAAYVVARYDAHQVAWLLGGDARYQEIGVDRWKRIGREVFRLGHGRLSGLHPCGVNWIGEEFRDEPWYGFIGYQSGHGDAEGDLRWLLQGPPATEWSRTPPLPVVNLEPNYETAHGYQHQTPFTDYHVRRAAYWSLLASPTAGLTYGHDAVWNWNAQTGPSEGHGGWHRGAVPPWTVGLDTPGIRSMTVLRGFFERIGWTSLVPAQELLAEQPGEKDIGAFVVIARSAQGTTVCYAPLGGTVRLREGAGLPATFRRVDPRTGGWDAPEPVRGGVLTLPLGEDWLTVLEPA